MFIDLRFFEEFSFSQKCNTRKIFEQGTRYLKIFEQITENENMKIQTFFINVICQRCLPATINYTPYMTIYDVLLDCDQAVAFTADIQVMIPDWTIELRKILAVE